MFFELSKNPEIMYHGLHKNIKQHRIFNFWTVVQDRY